MEGPGRCSISRPRPRPREDEVLGKVISTARRMRTGEAIYIELTQQLNVTCLFFSRRVIYNFFFYSCAWVKF